MGNENETEFRPLRTLKIPVRTLIRGPKGGTQMRHLWIIMQRMDMKNNQPFFVIYLQSNFFEVKPSIAQKENSKF